MSEAETSVNPIAVSTRSFDNSSHSAIPKQFERLERFERFERLERNKIRGRQ